MQWLRSRLRFDRNEWSGSLGDIGTDLPLIVALIPAAGLDAPRVFLLFGATQIVTGLVYGLPLPVQPLKAMAVLVISQGLPGEVLYGGGLAISLVMLALTGTGALEWLARSIPHPVVRGIQLGLGLKLASLALQRYVPSGGPQGYALAAGAFALTAVLLGNRRCPPALPVIGLGVLYAVCSGAASGEVRRGMEAVGPLLHLPAWEDVVSGFLLLALPQLPLSLSNAVIATDRALRDLFPDRPVGVRRIGYTYSLLNLVNPFFGGIPVCHGCGGLIGHYAFGARTGGSVVIYGAMYLVAGLFFAGPAAAVVRIFPLPLLGVILLFEALALMVLVRDVTASRADAMIGFLVGVLALGLPHGFLVGIAVGSLLYGLARRFGVLERL